MSACVPTVLPCSTALPPARTAGADPCPRELVMLRTPLHRALRSRTTPRRTAVLALAASASFLLAAAVPADAATRPTLYGSSIQMQAGETWAQAQARVEDDYGRLSVLRVFAGAPTDWTVDKWRRSLGDHNGMISFDAPAPDVLSGAYDDAFRAFFASVPHTRRTWWTYDHEPDVAYYQGRITDLQQYRDAFAHLARLAREADNAMLRATVVLVGWTGNPASGMSVSDFWPGEDLTDVVAWDVYNGWATRQGSYGDLGQVTFDRDAAQAVGKPWAIAEFGSLLVPGDDGTGRAAWITAISRFGYDNGAQFMCYFDNAGPGGADYRLTDEPSRAAWRSIVSDQSPYGS